MILILPTFLTLLSSIPFVFAEPSHLRLFHRIFHPSLSEVPFTERGTLKISETNAISFQLSSSFSQDVVGFAEALQVTQGTVDGTLYQVALERIGDASEANWDISSVKVCHLAQVTSEFIYLHTTDLNNPNPHALDYFVSPSPHDGTCPHSKSKKPKSLKSADSTAASTSASALHTFANNVNRLNTTVTLRGPRLPPLPELRTPPPLTLEGEPVVPVPEKTFLQKYWMYIVALLVITLVSGGPEEQQQN